VFPARISGAPSGKLAEHRIDPRTPTFDPFVVLATIAGTTERLRLGTHIYNIGLRHPFITARAAATLDIFSSGRLILGVGASWLADEWVAVGLDFKTRGRRVDECIAICRRLWTEEIVSHRGEFFRFEPVFFEPKPLQHPLPLHIGGDSNAALHRVARHGQGWIGMIHQPSTFAAALSTLESYLDEEGRSLADIDATALDRRPAPDDVDRWSAAGCNRLIVAPWQRSADSLQGLREFARVHRLEVS
jgi:probable F420-dependent oxidoreductase